MAFGDFTIEKGSPLPMGATLTKSGVNFSIFSRHAKAITLALFENDTPDSACKGLSLDPKKNRTGDVWHCHIPGLEAGALYLYKADGPFQPEKGFRFNQYKALLDPYAKAITDPLYWDEKGAYMYNPGDPALDLSFSYKDNIYTLPRCVVIDDAFDWQGDQPLNYPLRFSVIYETHVRGLTKHASSKVCHPGTYKGVVEKIPFFKELGVTSIEFLPIHEFNEEEINRENPETGEKLSNYWGYSTVSFFAPKISYSSDRTPGANVREFKEMVRELHKAGLEVILDVVFNHTAEGNECGPTYSFRGLDNSIYYILDGNRRYYKNYSGCGNTVNCNNTVVHNLIMDCLHYWVIEMHVDGFRFDLGSILGRNQKGNVMDNPPVLENIAEDPILRHTKIIAEAWDAGGAYQVGWFPGGRWAEWNDKYRDNVRMYWRGDPFEARYLATRLSGSSDLYLRDGRKPFHSINFITSHDGFTMNDLVSYDGKHNEENGEENRDGNGNNYSFNTGVEGPTNDITVSMMRERLMKNFFTTLMLSLGTPMILGGDEFGRTQRGNNNAYCQDNEISWYDWSLLEKNSGLFRFVKELIAFRLRHPGFMRPEFFTGKDGRYNSAPDITWFDEKGDMPGWDKLEYCLALRLEGSKANNLADRDDNDFFIMFNSGAEQSPFTVPDAKSKKWFRSIDTALPSPDDILMPGMEHPIPTNGIYLMKPRSMAALISR
ncbi:MAG: glycogen debranching protein GlgX [Treponema sp.]|jgi:glycogen operon protein|nr:glycogen debranching protein GlgX [Treponema sp.]